MGKQYFYTNTSDADLAKELLAGCGEMYIQKHEYNGPAVMSYNAAGDSHLLLADSDAASNDDYNSTSAANLYIIDDNSKVAEGKVKDTFADTGGTEIAFDASAMVLAEDGTTTPTFTDGTSYTVCVLSGSNSNAYGDYFGYMNDSVEADFTVESEPLEICTIEGKLEEVAENATKRVCMVNGATFNVPNSDVLSKVLNMTKYGDNTTTGRSEYHGGSNVDLSTYYQLTGLLKDHDGKYVAVQLFKGNLVTNGAIPLGGTGWKTLSWQYKGKRDTVRDSNSVNMFRIIRYS